MASQSDDVQPLSSTELDELKAMAAGTYIPLPKAAFNLRDDTLYGGIAGLVLPVECFEPLPGLVLRQTYAHVIAPFIVAFAPPPLPATPHPAPWAALKEYGLSIFVEMKLDAKNSPLGFDRLNTLWFVLALLRLRLSLPLQMPLIADRPLQDVPADIKTS